MSGSLADELDAPIFLLAASWRTGSTLLQRLVTAVDGVLVWGEGSFFHRFARIFGAVERHFADVQWNAEALTGSTPHTEWIPVLSPSLDDFHGGVRAFMDRVYGEAARRHGARRWGVKEVRDGAVAAAHLMHRAYPRAKFVFLVRDPFATLASVMRTDFWSRFSGAEEFLATWTDHARDFRDPAVVGELPCHVLRYEDLIAEGRGAHPRLTELFDFLGLPLEPAVFDALEAVVGRTRGTALSAEDRAVVERCTDGVRQTYGY